MHDAVAWRDNIDILKCQLCPVNKVEAIFITTIFNGAVFFQGIWIEAAAFNSERMINNELHWHDRINLRRIPTLLRDGITQASKINQRGLTQNIVAHHTCRKPWKIQLTLTFNQLF